MHEDSRPRLLPQAKRQAFLASPEYRAAQAAEAAAVSEDAAAPLHAENEWNISVIGTPVCAEPAVWRLTQTHVRPSGDAEDGTQEAAVSELPAGLQFAMPQVRRVLLGFACSLRMTLKTVAAG